MKTTLCIAWILSFSFISAQIKTDASKQEDNITLQQLKTESLNVGYSFKLRSKVLNEDRTIMIALPDDYASSTSRYPVFYIVDAQWNFKLTVQTMNVLSSNGLIPPMILVGIHTGDKRDKDLLPTRNEESKLGGGADNLHSFIKKELIPFVENNYRTCQFRVLAGASFGGVFVMYALMSDPQLFNSYLALSPSMWWDYRVMLKRMEEFLQKNPDLQDYLYIAVANEGSGMGVGALATLLKRNSPKKLVWRFDEYPEEIHGTVSYKGTYDGLRFVFADWLSVPIEFGTKGDMLLPNDSVVVTINSPSNQVRYTLDNSEPKKGSPLFKKPIILKKPAILKAIPFYGFEIPGKRDSLIIDYIPQLIAETNLPTLKTGLKYSYYEGDWNNLPDYDTLHMVKSGITTNFKMDERKKDDLFAMCYNGFIDIPKDNVYSFYLSSDDGSQLIIADKKIVVNDGLHGVIEKKGKAYLKKGIHRITVLFFQKGGEFKLSLEYESRDIVKQKVPDSALFCSEN